ncbi:MAG: hypothetical protein IPK26_14775 [Planctomycetes bacterium]|nr:hypothetical protein [Planctomycetota bacterium]
MLRWLPAALMFATLGAQGPTVALVRDPERFLEVVDLHGVRGNVLGDDVAHAATPFGPHVAQFLRAHAKPAVTAKDDVVAVGPDHLALLGTRAQLDHWQAVLRHWQKATASEQRLSFELLRIPATKSAAIVAALQLDKTDRAAVLPATEEQATMLAPVRTAATARAELTLDARPWRLAKATDVRDVDYVRDVVPTATESGETVWARVPGTLKSGAVADLFCAPMPDGSLGVEVSLLWHDVQMPIPKFDTTVGDGIKVRIDLPSWAERRLAAGSTLRRGQCAVLVATPRDTPRFLGPDDLMVVLVRLVD